MGRTRVKYSQMDPEAVTEHLQAADGYAPGKVLSTDSNTSEIKWNINTGGSSSGDAGLVYVEPQNGELLL